MAVQTKKNQAKKIPLQHSKTPQMDFAFGKENYRIMLIGIGIILIGFMFMSGGNSNDPNIFNPELFSFRRITLAPITVLLGFAIEIYAIVKKPNE